MTQYIKSVKKIVENLQDNRYYYKFAPAILQQNPLNFSIMEVCIYSVTTQGNDNKPVVKRFSTLEKALEYAGKIVTSPERAALVGNESCVLDE